MIVFILGLILGLTGFICLIKSKVLETLVQREEKCEEEDREAERKAKEENANCYLKFDQFKQWYAISPDAWMLKKDAVIKKALIKEDNDYSKAIFYFNNEDTGKYEEWRYDLVLAKRYEENRDKVTQLLKSVQEDIEVYLNGDSNTH